MNNVLLVDFGSTYTKITAVDTEGGRLLGTAQAITTVATDIMTGFNDAVTALVERTGQLPFNRVWGCSSAAGGLKMVAVGLVPELTAEAANRAALGAGAKVLGVYGHELNDYEIDEIAALIPDIILLAGGTDGGNKEVILHNAAMLSRLERDIPIIVAGNKSVTPAVVRRLAATKSEVVPTENVMPKLNVLNIEPARETIRGVFLRRIVEAKGLSRFHELGDRLVCPTPAAVLKAAELLSRGTDREPGLGDLLVVDIGGATTDVYSLAAGDPTRPLVTVHGLPEPFAKRTVEGDLGLRYSAGALIRAAGVLPIAAAAGATADEVLAYAAKVERQVDYLPPAGREAGLETALARACARVGVDRHAGRLENYYTPTGVVFLQTGKDLTGVKTVIGTGGVIIHHNRPVEILAGVKFDPAEPLLLKPREPEFYVDRSYIMAAMGLLADEYPNVALRILKKHLREPLI